MKILQRLRGGDAETRHARRTMLLLAAAVFVFHLPFIGWGLPEANAAHRVKCFGYDDLLPLEPLAEMHNTFLEAKPDRNLAYPWFHYFVVSVGYGPYLAYLFVVGQFKNPSPDFPFGFADPVGALRNLCVIGRLITIAMAAGTVAAAYRAARTLWDHRTGLVAAALTATSYLLVYYARTGNLDVPMTFWCSAGVAVFAEILVKGLTPRRAAWLGVLAGLGMGTKDQALTVFLPMAGVLLLPRFRRSGEGNGTWRAPIAGLIAAVVAYVVATGMLVDPARHIAHVHRMFFDSEATSTAFRYHDFVEMDAAGVRSMLATTAIRFSHALSLPALLAALAGIWIVGRRSPRYLTLLLPIPLHVALLVLPIGFVVFRYLLPYVVILDLFAAHALLKLLDGRGRALGLTALVVVIGARVLVATDLLYAQVNETRSDAGAWLRAAASEGATVEYFGTAQKVPALPESISSRLIAGRTAWNGEFDHGPRVLDYLRSEGPDFVIVIPDWTSGPELERSKDCPSEVWDALLDGSAGYELGAHFPRRHLLPRPLGRPPLDYPVVAPPVRVFVRRRSSVGEDSGER